MHTTQGPSAEEILTEIEQDFQQYVDAKQQKTIKATFDLSLRDRMRRVFEAVANYTDTIAELKDEILDLEHAPCTECEDMAEQVNATERESERLVAQVDDLVAERNELREALGELYDWQNGCPLPSYEKGWSAAMEKAQRLARPPLKP